MTIEQFKNSCECLPEEFKESLFDKTSGRFERYGRA